MALLLLAAFAAAQPATLPATEIREGECYAMVQTAQQVVSTRIPGLHVMGLTAGNGPFVATLPDRTGAIACPRSSVLPVFGDRKVPEAGFPLMIMETTAGHRVGALEITEGRFQFRMVHGDLTEAETAQLQVVLNEMQEAPDTSRR